MYNTRATVKCKFAAGFNGGLSKLPTIHLQLFQFFFFTSLWQAKYNMYTCQIVPFRKRIDTKELFQPVSDTSQLVEL
jgi:hypothetical protein